MTVTSIHYRDTVRVQLTESGRALSPAHLLIDQDGYITTILWDIMREFGPHLFHGQEQPFASDFELVQRVDRSYDDAVD